MGNPEQPPPYEATQHTYPQTEFHAQEGKFQAAYPHLENSEAQPQTAYPHPQTAYPHPANPQPVYCQSPQVPAPVTLVVQADLPNRFGPKAFATTCPSCNSHITTRTEMKATSSKHMWALILCVFGFWPCCLIPYCMDSCQNTDHYCSACDAYLGTYRDD